MAYVFSDPSSLEYILRQAHDELRRGENQHYRTTAVQYTNHVKELMGNMERYLEAYGVQLPIEVLEGAETFAAASAEALLQDDGVFSSLSSRREALHAQRAHRPGNTGGGTKSVSSIAGSSVREREGVLEQRQAAKGVLSPYRNGGGEAGGCNLVTPRDLQQRGRIMTSSSSVGRASVPKAPAALCASLSETGHPRAVSDTPSSTLRDVNAPPHHPQNSRRLTTNAEGDASILYDSQQATRAQPAFSTSLPSMGEANISDSNTDSIITSPAHSRVADDNGVTSGSPSMVTILRPERYSDGEANRGSSGAAKDRSDTPWGPSPALLHRSPGSAMNEGERGNCGCTHAGEVEHTRTTYPTVSNAIATASMGQEADAGAVPELGFANGADLWGEFGTFVQSITESRQNSNLASLQSAVAAAGPFSEGIIAPSSAASPAIPRELDGAARDGYGSGAVPAALPSAFAPRPSAALAPAGFQLPYVLSTGTSMTTPSTPPLGAGCAKREYQIRQLPTVRVLGTWGPATAFTSQVAHGAGGRAVRALATANVISPSEASTFEAVPSAGGPLSPSSDDPFFPKNRPVWQPQQIAEHSERLPQAEQRQWLPLQTQTISWYQTTVPPYRVASGPFSSQQQQEQHDCITGLICPAPLVPVSSMPVKASQSPEKTQLMRRLRAVLERASSAPPSEQQTSRRSIERTDGMSPLERAGSMKPVKGLKSFDDAENATSVRTASDTWLVGTAGSSSPPPATQQQRAASRNVVDRPVSGESADFGAREGLSNLLYTALAAPSQRPYTSSVREVSMGRIASLKASQGTALPRGAVSEGGDFRDGWSGLSSREQPSLDNRDPYRRVSTATMSASGQAQPGDVGAVSRWELGSCSTTNSNRAPTRMEETVAPPLTDSTKGYTSSWSIAWPSAHSTRVPPPPGFHVTAAGAESISDGDVGLVRSEIGNESLVGAVEGFQGPWRPSSQGDVGVMQYATSQDTQESPREAKPFFLATAPSPHIGKKVLLQRLHGILGGSAD